MTEHPEQAQEQGWHLMRNGPQAKCRACGQAHDFLSRGCQPAPVAKEKVGHVGAAYPGLTAIPITDYEAADLKERLSRVGRAPFNAGDTLTPGMPGFDQEPATGEPGKSP